MIIVDAGSSYKHGAYMSDKSDAITILVFDEFHIKAEMTTRRKI